MKWLSSKTGKTYRLLSEAEWENAARGQTEPGSYPRYFYGDSENELCQFGNGADQTAKRKVRGASGWSFSSCSDNYAYTGPVGGFKPNRFGLYDMLGNVWQWVEDCYHKNYNGVSGDASAWIAGDCSRRVLRGGSWDIDPRLLRAAYRNRYNPDYRYVYNGFRLARTITS